MWYCVTVPELDEDGRYAKAADERSAVSALFDPALNEGWCGDGFAVWITGEIFRVKVTPVTDTALIARLDGAPVLPLDFGDKPTTAPYAPDAYQRQVMATWGGGANLIPAVLGLAGEVGEVVDLHKKHFFKPGHEAAREQVMDELADAAYYMAVLAHLWGFTFDDMFAHLAGKLADGHGYVTPSNSMGLEDGHE